MAKVETNKNENGKAQKTPFYRKWWFWVIVVLVIYSVATSGGSDEDEEVEEAAEEMAEGEEVVYTAGTYSATGTGIGEIVVTMTFDDASITEVELDLSNETESIGQAAGDTLVAEILEAQSSEIDAVSGATITSEAVMEAASNCIAQAKGEGVADEAEEDEESHIYDDAEIRDVMNGTGDTKLGEFSLIEADSSEVTLEVLEDWYFNYVIKNDYNWCMILFSDYDDNTGVHAVTGFVEVGVIFAEEDDGEYYVASSEDSTLYVPSDGSLVEMVYDDEDEEESEETEADEAVEEAVNEAAEAESEDSSAEGADETSETEEVSEVTLGMSNALQSARNYLSVLAFSYTGLMEQLEYEGYSTEEATYAVDNCGADWYEQAVAKAEEYLSVLPFSYSGLIDQLEYDGFTAEEATYGADNCGADWYEQAVAKAEDYLSVLSFSRSGLIDQLEYDGFTSEQAEYAADAVGY